ncbi:MAG: flavodoxin [Schwartzia sp.]|nr:flavodoxin [Schwartzia sp. (in: firmicutes)]
MSKIAVIYWSGTGNTESMANAVTEGAKDAGADASLFTVDKFSVSEMTSYDAFIFGCPAMGAEVLEESEFEPFFVEAEKNISGKPVALFGSYGWGGGQYMRDWEERVKADGANLVADGLDIENAPTDENLVECKSLGKKVAEAAN